MTDQLHDKPQCTTPRTDALIQIVEGGIEYANRDDLIALARQLERELAEEKQVNAQYHLDRVAWESTLSAEGRGQPVVPDILAWARKEFAVDTNGDPFGAQPEAGWETGYAAGIRCFYRVLRDRYSASPSGAGVARNAEGRDFDAEAALAGIADVLNQEMRENGDFRDQIAGIKEDMRPFIRQLVDAVRTRSTPSSTAATPDGYAVLMDDKASAPKGFWFCGIWNSLESAEIYAAKVKGVRIVPMSFAPSAIERGNDK